MNRAAGGGAPVCDRLWTHADRSRDYAGWLPLSPPGFFRPKPAASRRSGGGRAGLRPAATSEHSKMLEFTNAVHEHMPPVPVLNLGNTLRELLRCDSGSRSHANADAERRSVTGFGLTQI